MADYSQWYPWTPSAGNLTIVFPGNQAINSVWVPHTPSSGVAFYDQNGNLFFSSQLSGYVLVPMPSQCTSVTLASPADYNTPIYATSKRINPIAQYAVSGGGGSA